MKTVPQELVTKEMFRLMHEYEVMQEKLELLTDLQESLNQLEKGAGISHGDAKRQILRRIRK